MGKSHRPWEKCMNSEIVRANYEKIVAEGGPELKEFFQLIRQTAEKGEPRVITLTRAQENVVWFALNEQELWFFSLATVFSNGKLTMTTNGGWPVFKPMTMHFQLTGEQAPIYSTEA